MTRRPALSGCFASLLPLALVSLIFLLPLTACGFRDNASSLHTSHPAFEPAPSEALATSDNGPGGASSDNSVNNSSQDEALDKQEMASRYNQGKYYFNLLQENASLAAKRDNWLKCINIFKDLYLENPDHSLAPASLYMICRTRLRMFDRFHNISDLDAAINQLQNLAKFFPDSRLADDALFALGQLYLDNKNDRQQAVQYFSQVVNEYPNGDMYSLAAQKMQQLSQKFDIALPDSMLDRSPDALNTVFPVQHWSSPQYGRVVVGASGPVAYKAGLLPKKSGRARLYIDLADSYTTPADRGTITAQDKNGLLRVINTEQKTGDSVRVVVEAVDIEHYEIYSLPDPFRVIVDVRSKEKPADRLSKKAPKPSPATIATADNAVAKSEAARPTVKTPKPKPAKSEPKLAATEKPEPKLGAEATSAKTPAPNPAKSELKLAATEKPEPKPSAEATSAKTPAPNPTESEQKLTATEKPEPKPSAEATSAKTPAPNPTTSAPKLTTVEKPESKPGAEATEAAAPAPVATAVSQQVSPPPPSAPSMPRLPSLAQQLGLGVKKIVIDPGHGGKDPGATAAGLKEKDVVLAVAKRLKSALEKELGCQVTLTRNDDRFLGLEERTAFANTQGADLFLSLHLNAHTSTKVHGFETYYLNLTTNPAAMRVAALENATSTHQLSDLQDILSNIMKNSKIAESARLARLVNDAVAHGLSEEEGGTMKNYGVKQAPFYVLIGAQMPAILLEMAFITNPDDAKRITSDDYIDAMTKHITQGVLAYVNSNMASLER